MTAYDLLVLICMATVALAAALDVVERIERKIKSRRRSSDQD